jgi:hypothetical protein
MRAIRNLYVAGARVGSTGGEATASTAMLFLRLAAGEVQY